MTHFHPGAQNSYAATADDLLREVQAFPSPPRALAQGGKFKIHPSAVIGPGQMIGPVRINAVEVDAIGNETGRFWDSADQRVGWTGEAFQKMKRLADKIANSKELRGLVSESFILDEIFFGLCQTL